MLKPEYAHDILSAAPDVNSDKMLPHRQGAGCARQKPRGPAARWTACICSTPSRSSIQAMEAAQSIDTEKIVACIDGGKMASFDTIYGPGAWGSHPEVYGNNHCGKKPLLMSTFTDGKLTFDFVQ